MGARGGGDNSNNIGTITIARVAGVNLVASQMRGWHFIYVLTALTRHLSFTSCVRVKKNKKT